MERYASAAAVRASGREARKYEGPRKWGPSKAKNWDTDECRAKLRVKLAANPRRRDNDTALRGAVSGVLQAASASFMS